MWCPKCSKVPSRAALRAQSNADQEHPGDDEGGAGGAAACDPLADERSGERDCEVDARLPHGGDGRGGREP